MTKIIEKENSEVMHMKEELLTNISAYLNNFTRTQTESRKNAFETVHDSIQMSVNDILSILLEINYIRTNIYIILNLKYPLDYVGRQILQRLRA